jgi:hypothetical protein
LAWLGLGCRLLFRAGMKRAHREPGRHTPLCVTNQIKSASWPDPGYELILAGSAVRVVWTVSGLEDRLRLQAQARLWRKGC